LPASAVTGTTTAALQAEEPALVLFTWSGGKDSALALYELRRAGGEVAALLTTVTRDYGRVSMHGVRFELLERQAAAIGLPLEVVYIGKGADNAEYEAAMAERLGYHKEQGVSVVAFGDIFLEDLRRYREANLGRLGLKGVFPIWGRDTHELAASFLALGFKAVLTCVDTRVLGAAFAGREYDARLLAELPGGVDPCGENGEFHTFVYNGPLFREPVAWRRGEVVLREERFCYCDLVPFREGA
jgi:uncharacterized protein (TIGR00290 family)